MNVSAFHCNNFNDKAFFRKILCYSSKYGSKSYMTPLVLPTVTLQRTGIYAEKESFVGN